METLVRAGGGTTADIARVTVFVKDDSVRPHVNAAWLAMFPDADDRPARHTQVVDLQHGMVVQLEMLAFVQERR
jgi:2-iminobutanoate/2-iminopropanoate deaminase